MRVIDSSFEPGVATPRVGTTALERVAWTIAAGLLVTYVALLWQFAVDWPLHDDLTQIVAIPGYLVQLPTLREKLALLTDLALEHRATTIRLAGLIGGAMPDGIDLGWLIALGNAMALASAACIVFAYPRGSRAIAAVLALLLCTSLTHYTAQFHATGALQHFGVMFWTFAALIALERGSRVLAVMLAVVAAFTSANGLLVFIGAAVLMALRHRRREAAAWVIAGVIATLSYFAGGAAASKRSVAAIVQDPIALVSAGLATLGSVAETLDASRWLGAAIVVTWAVLAATGAWRRMPPLVIAMAACAGLSCALVAAGRAELGAELVSLSRYRMYSALTLLATVCAVTWAVSDRVRVQAILASCLLATAIYATAWSTMMSPLMQLYTMQLAFRDHFAAANSGHYDGYTREWGDFTLRRAREIGVYSGARRASPPVQIVEARPPDARDAPRVTFLRSFDGRTVASVIGIAQGRHRTLVVWLGNGAHTLKGHARTQSYRGERFERFTAFRATMSVAKIAPGTYRVGLGDESGGVLWTQQTVDVR